MFQVNKGMKIVLFLFVVVPLLFLSPSVEGKDYVNPQLLVSPADIEKNIDNWVVIDCRDSKDYKAGHIPGAINLGAPCAKVMRDTTLRVKKAEELEKLLGNAGVGNDKPVVVYADAKLITGATVGFWILEYLGHDKVYFLNGGIESWLAAGKSIEKTEIATTPATFKAKAVKSTIAATEEILKIAKGAIKNVNVIDSRTDKEHKGEDIRSLRGGHIPNTTINVSHLDTYDVQTGRIKSMDELENLLGKLDKNKRTIAYCQSGTRSTLIYLELRLMGFKNPANYDDSWIVYGSNVNYPAVNENWYDFVKANDAIKTAEGMKKEIEELKKGVKPVTGGY